MKTVAAAPFKMPDLHLARRSEETATSDDDEEEEDPLPNIVNCLSGFKRVIVLLCKG